MIAKQGFIRDDFAGPGGASEGLRLLGLAEDVGIEFEQNAVATARAAGHSRWYVDVTSDECRNYPWPLMWLYLASPPCQTFSMAGKGAGRAHIEALLCAAEKVAGGMLPEDAIAAVQDEALDVRSVLVLEPLYVITRHRPRNVALEQVPTVLSIWEAYAELLRAQGYNVWCGVLSSEQFGVPQTRKRAILIASLDREVSAPSPTHSRYHSRSPEKLDDGVLPWVTMAQALGWGMTQRPYPTVATGTGAGGTDPAAIGGSGARRTIREEMEAGRWVGSDGYGRKVDAPNGGDTSWSERRPSPTIVGSFAPDIVAAPGYRKAGDGPRQAASGSIRVTVQEAGVLQSFPADYPWQGSKSRQFEQCGNAYPPRMAAAVVSALLQA